jgi:hypothetical protein
MIVASGFTPRAVAIGCFLRDMFFKGQAITTGIISPQASRLSQPSSHSGRFTLCFDPANRTPFGNNNQLIWIVRILSMLYTKLGRS